MSDQQHETAAPAGGKTGRVAKKILTSKRAVERAFSHYSFAELGRFKTFFEGYFQKREEEDLRQQLEAQRREDRLWEILAHMNAENISIEELNENLKQARNMYIFTRPDGSIGSWNGRGKVPADLKKLIDEGHKLEEYRFAGAGKNLKK